MKPTNSKCAVDDKNMDVDVPPEITDEGIKIVEEFLRSWAASNDGEDIVMDEELSSEEQLEQLKAHVDRFLPQIESNPWLKSLLTTF